MLRQAHAEMLGQEGDVLEVVEEEEEIDGLVPALAVSAFSELMESMADRWRVVKGRHRSALAAIAMGLKWMCERKRRVDEGGTAAGWLEAMLVRLHAKEEQGEQEGIALEHGTCESRAWR